MTHPEDLLAAYVDDALAPAERAEVEAHLGACARCREEVALARRAVAALAALPEEPVPLGVTGPVLAEAGRRAAPRRSRWVAALAAAAVIALAGAVVLPQVLQAPPPEREGAGASIEALAPRQADAATGAPSLEISGADLDERAARRFAELEPDQALMAGAESATPQARDEAVSCLLASGAEIDETHRLVRLVAARYLGTPAYLGVFHEGPGGDEPPARVVVWIVAREDCRILTLLSRRL